MTANGIKNASATQAHQRSRYVIMPPQQLGVVYLIHFDTPYKHAKHYLGWTLDLNARLAAHANGSGANLMRIVAEAGITWRLARVWSGTRSRERQLKLQGGSSRKCPLCGVKPRVTRPSPQPLSP